MGPIGSEAAGELAPFVQRLESRLPQTAELIAQRVWAEIPAYAALDDARERALVLEAINRNLGAFVQALAQGKELTPQQIDALGVVGEQRAHQGIPLEDVLRAFRMVGLATWEHLAAQLVGADLPSKEALIGLGAALMRFTDALSSSVAQHYLHAQDTIIRRQEAARREFLHDLLVEGSSSSESMARQAKGFGYDLGRHHFAVAAVSRDPDRDAAAQEVSLSNALGHVGKLFPASGRPLVGRRGDQTIAIFAVAPVSIPRSGELGNLVVAELGQHWRLGVGGPYPGLEGCRRCFFEACEALEMGMILSPDRQVYPFEEFLLYRFLRKDSDLSQRFVQTVLGSIIEHDRRRRSDLIKTLEAYFASGENAKDTGHRMFAHPHTITYRLRQIEKLSSRNLKDPEDKLHLQLAVKALRIAEESAPEEPGAGLRRVPG